MPCTAPDSSQHVDHSASEPPSRRYHGVYTRRHCRLLRLVISDACKADEGAYRCNAENDEGVAVTTGYLSVTGARAQVY